MDTFRNTDACSQGLFLGRSLLLFVGLIPLASCGTTGEPPDNARDDMTTRSAYPGIPPEATSVSFTTLEELTATYSPFEDSEMRPIRSPDDWADHLVAFGGPDGPVPASPDVDFANEMVLVVAIGYRPSGGYAVEVEGVFAAGDQRYVAVLETQPGEGCMASMALTAPVTAVRTANATGSVHFFSRIVANPC